MINTLFELSLLTVIILRSRARRKATQPHIISVGIDMVLRNLSALRMLVEGAGRWDLLARYARWQIDRMMLSLRPLEGKTVMVGIMPAGPGVNVPTDFGASGYIPISRE